MLAGLIGARCLSGLHADAFNENVCTSMYMCRYARVVCVISLMSSQFVRPICFAPISLMPLELTGMSGEHKASTLSSQKSEALIFLHTTSRVGSSVSSAEVGISHIPHGLAKTPSDRNGFITGDRESLE